MIDTHCHLEHYRDSFQIASEIERLGIYTIAVSMVPEGFHQTQERVKSSKFIRAALGLHPAFAASHRHTLAEFSRLVNVTKYIGEVGLDYSLKDVDRAVQREVFAEILELIKGRNKVVSVHSVRSAPDVLKLLLEHSQKTAIFHWYSGDKRTLEKLLDHGYYVSVNPAMMRSENGRKVIALLPRDRTLTETDGPFAKIDDRPVRPTDLQELERDLASVWKISADELSNQLKVNLKTLLKGAEIDAPNQNPLV